MCPQDNKPEYAFIGRSNVGKSSLINMLTNNKKLAKTSATPGKTLLINHFIINNEWYLVDLPGYGFAKRSKKEVQKLEQMINGYILQRQQLVNVFLLVDIRLEAQKIDLDFIQWLGASAIVLLVGADKRKGGSRNFHRLPRTVDCIAMLHLDARRHVENVVVPVEDVVLEVTFRDLFVHVWDGTLQGEKFKVES